MAAKFSTIIAQCCVLYVGYLHYNKRFRKTPTCATATIPVLNVNVTCHAVYAAQTWHLILLSYKQVKGVFGWFCTFSNIVWLWRQIWRKAHVCHCKTFYLTYLWRNFFRNLNFHGQEMTARIHHEMPFLTQNGGFRTQKNAERWFKHSNGLPKGYLKTYQ